MTEPAVRKYSQPASQLPGYARQRPFALMLLITGLVGWLASGWLVLERLRTLQDPNYVTSCDLNPWVSCGEVFKTWQAALFGFPNPLLGIVCFAVIITVAMALLAGAGFARWFWIGLQAGVTLGFVFVVWLWSQALFAIVILCPYCMVVWAAMIPLFVLTTARNISHGIIPATPGIRRFTADYAWIVVALLWVAAAASIFFRFMNAFLGA